MLAAVAFSCGDGSKNSSEREGYDTEEQAPLEGDESRMDTTQLEMDTTNTGGMNRQNQYDTLNRP